MRVEFPVKQKVKLRLLEVVAAAESQRFFQTLPQCRSMGDGHQGDASIYDSLVHGTFHIDRYSTGAFV